MSEHIEFELPPLPAGATNRRLELKLTKQDAENLLDALGAWNDTVGPKELEDNEVGLDDMRYHKLERNLRKMLEE